MLTPGSDEALAALGERLRVRPLPPGLLREALTHASYVNEVAAAGAIPSNERLEFLGDAVLGMIVAVELFNRYPDAGEGELTRLRSAIVRGSALATAGERLGIGEFLILGRGEEAAGGRKRDRNLAGAMEAIMGAVYRAHGYRTTRSFIMRTLAQDLRRVYREGALIDAKSSLQHLVQSRWHEPPDYVTVEQGDGGSGRRFRVEVRVDGRILGSGEGSSKREAQQAAAREAIATLDPGLDSDITVIAEGA